MTLCYNYATVGFSVGQSYMIAHPWRINKLLWRNIFNDVKTIVTVLYFDKFECFLI